MNNSKQAYSLLEMMLVLCILALVIGLLSLVNFRSLQDKIVTKYFWADLSSQLLLAQEEALVCNQVISIKFRPNLLYIQFLNGQTGETYQLFLPENWVVLDNLSFRYLPSGHVSSFKTVRFRNQETQEGMALKFQLGSGRFVYQEE